MKIPDVNVWLAAVWSRHSQHRSAKDWVDKEDGELAFCRVTQMAFLRLLTNPSVTQRDALSPNSRRLHLASMEELGLRRLLTNDAKLAGAARALDYAVVSAGLK